MEMELFIQFIHYLKEIFKYINTMQQLLQYI